VSNEPPKRRRAIEAALARATLDYSRYGFNQAPRISYQVRLGPRQAELLASNRSL
jgi:hypothetical protein